MESSNAFYKAVDEVQKKVILYLGHSHSPISIDEMASLAVLPVVKILNIMEDLISNGLVYEKEELGKGIYFINNEKTEAVLDSIATKKDRFETIEKLIAYYEKTITDEDEAALILAGLYSKTRDGWKGAGYIKRAADYLQRIGQPEQAANYYDHLMKMGDGRHISAQDCDFFLEISLGRIASQKHLMPIKEQISILSAAEKLATRHQRWEALSKIKLSLGEKKLQSLGRHKQAFAYIKDFLAMAEKSKDPTMLRTATLLMSEYLHWEGKFAQVVQQYEDVAQSLEDFGDDETMLRAFARVGLCYVRCGQVSRGMGMIEAVRSKAKMLGHQHVIIITHMLSMLSFFEIRRFPEAGKHTDIVLSYPEKEVGHFILSPVYICKAYLLWMKNEESLSMEYMNRCIHSIQTIGWPHWNGAWNFDFLDAAEAKGYVLPEFNYDDEIKRILNWDDIYMKGVAFRYRAQRDMKRQRPYKGVLEDLKQSEKYLIESGAQLELARTRIAMGNLLMKRGETQKGKACLEKAWSLFSRVDTGLFPKDLMSSMPQEQKVEHMIDRMININESLGTVSDMRGFLKKVITMAMDFTMAMRGAFFMADSDGGQTIAASRNLDPLMLKPEQLEFVKFVVGQAARHEREIVVPGNKNCKKIEKRLSDISGIDALVCMPVRLKDKIQGYLYLDNRFGKKAFSKDHLPYIRLVSSQAAVGITNIRTYEEMEKHKNRFEDESSFYKKEMGLLNPAEKIIGESDGIKRVLKAIKQVAVTDSAVLITGETGVGKEMAAKAIHDLSPRSHGPFIPVNLAALPHDLVASELFGYEKGAFTGADKRNKGRFELADGGTIFLDEIGDLQPAIQVKLLRVLQENSFERLGSAKTIKSDFRVIAATNKDLYAEVEKNNFRQDLFYRLNVFPLHIPPLRARKTDIKLFADYFIRHYSRRTGKMIRKMSEAQVEKLMQYNWPGNVRELKHLLEREVILCEGNRISFSGFNEQEKALSSPDPGKFVPLFEFEKTYIEQVLKAVQWKLSGPNSASLILDMKPTTLLYRMKKLGIKKPDPV